jgi:hypothetical protein
MKAAYPKYFVTPEGRKISIKTLSNACKVIRKNPSADYPGWDWFPQTGYNILNSVMDGINDRINQREIGRAHD